MNRALSHRTAATLLKEEFSARGVTLAHTEVLDIVAKLQGFNAWSHLKSAGADECNAPSPEEAAMPPAPEPDAPPRDPWEVQVFDATGTKVAWNIQHNLTDRWGELNTYGLEKKPALSLLSAAAGIEVLKYLRNRMVTELSFVAFKDGEFGLLHEVEYCTAESDGRTGQAGHAYPREANLLPSLVRGAQALAPQYPKLQIAVLPGGSDLTREGRPAVWAWAPLGALRTMTDKELDNLVVNLDRCASPLGAVSPWGHG